MKVADLTTEELKELISKTIEEKFRELNEMIYAICGLTEAEIAIVEQRRAGLYF